MKVTILEYCPEAEYQFYEATTKSPVDAIENYIKENNLGHADITFPDGDTVCEAHEVRAYETEVTN